MRPLILLVSIAFANASLADPCGMVPPIYEGRTSPIKRIGLQKTYVFFDKESKNDAGKSLETFVIRPSFSGNVDNFGMLIPFPTVPSMRKVPDNIFTHIAASIDPPEVRLDLRPRRKYKRSMSETAKSAPPPSPGLRVRKDEVVVLKEEAVGMYQIAVLEAGSPTALSKWMSQNNYQYPKGMDEAVGSYVNEGWCFVAVKTRVGVKANVNPAPGLRKVSPQLPQGGSFDGNVQAMGFRFWVDELVVPMKLSTFNEGESRNIVYVLHDENVRIRGLDESLVRRQLSGEKVRHNVSELLPVRVIGGDPSQASAQQWERLRPQRNPVPHNGLSRDLFASDLHAARSNELEHQFESREKVLLNINERLGLRGPNIDRLVQNEMQKAVESGTEGALIRLDQKKLTVIDGDFPREFLSANNLFFDAFDMSPALNHRQKYNARSTREEGEIRGIRVEYDGSKEGETTQEKSRLLRFWKKIWN